MNKNQNVLLINQPWLREELTALGFNVLTAGVGEGRGLDFPISDSGIQIEDLLKSLPVTPDRIVVFDDSSTLKIFGLERLKIPSIFYSVDAHHHSRWHRYLSSLFDLTLIAQRQHIPEFETESDNVKWFPLWPLRLPVPTKVREKIVSFRGNLRPDLHPERAKFFDKLKEIVPVDASLGDWVEPYSKALIVINQTVGGDLNFRNFEALAGGALLVTPRLNNGFSELFVEGEDYIAYEEGNAEEAGNKIKYYLENSTEAETIARRGREKLLAKHTSQARAEELANHLLELKPRGKESKNTAAMLSLLPTILAYKYHENNPNWERYLEEALSLLNQAIEEEEPLWEEYPSAGVFILLVILVETKRFFDLEEIGQRLLEEEKIDSIINVVFLVHALTNQKKNDEALALAKGYSDNPEEFIGSIPSLLSHVRDTVITSLS